MDTIIERVHAPSDKYTVRISVSFSDDPFVAHFSTYEDAQEFYGKARSGRALTLNVHGSGTVVLYPKSILSVVIQSPKQTFISPRKLIVRGGK